MNLILKRLKTYPHMSEETQAFDAELHLDGKLVAHVSNDGKGGANRYHWLDPKVGDQIEKYAQSLPPVDSEYGPLDMDLDLFIGRLIDAEEDRKLVAELQREVVRKLRPQGLVMVVGLAPGAVSKAACEVGDVEVMKVRLTEKFGATQHVVLM